MRRGASGHRGRPKRAAQGVLEADAGDMALGVDPNGLPWRSPVFRYGTRIQVGWIGYDSTRIERLTDGKA